MTFSEKITALRACVGELSENDQRFALSLLRQGEKNGKLSEKQIVWVDRLTERATKPKTAKTAEVGNLANVIALFDTARKHLNWPAIMLGYDSRLLRLTVAGAKAKVPGSVNVVDKESKTWFGRVHTDGRFEMSTGNPAPQSAIDLLTRFAADPAGVASEHGRLTGNCCFCNTALTDERSTAVGYGPVCADHYGLAWGKSKTSFTAMAAAATSLAQ